MITSDDITIELRSAPPNGKTKAFADVTLSLGECGVISISGFSLVGSGPRVVPPARKGDQRYFDVVLLTGKVKTLVYTLIGMEYRSALEKSAKEIV